jgi:hypothetical protein
MLNIEFIGRQSVRQWSSFLSLSTVVRAHGARVGGAGFSYRQLNINATAVRSVLTNAWAAGDRGVLCLATDYLGPTARRRWSQLDLQVSGGV